MASSLAAHCFFDVDSAGEWSRSDLRPVGEPSLTSHFDGYRATMPGSLASRFGRPAAMRPKRRELSRLGRWRQALKAVLAMIVVGLTPRHLGPSTPRLSALAREGSVAALDT